MTARRCKPTAGGLPKDTVAISHIVTVSVGNIRLYQLGLKQMEIILSFVKGIKTFRPTCVINLPLANTELARFLLKKRMSFKPF